MAVGTGILLSLGPGGNERERRERAGTPAYDRLAASGGNGHLSGEPELCEMDVFRGRRIAEAGRGANNITAKPAHKTNNRSRPRTPIV